jgi:exopolysaccharide production protein ExoQ
MTPEAPAPERRLTTFERVEVIITIGLVAMMSNALLGPLLDPKETGGDSVALLRLSWLPVYGATAVLAAIRFPQMLRYWAPTLLVSALVLWAFASVHWSIDPGVSQRRAIALAGTTLLGLYLAARYDGRELAEIVAFTFVLLALGSYFVCIFVPSMGVHQDVNAGLWRGLWYEKNAMGMMMVYGSLAAVAAAITSPRRRKFWIGSLVLFMGLIVMTHSATSLVTLAIVLGGAAALGFMSLGPAAAVSTLWLGVAGALGLTGFYVLAPKLFYGAIGKDPSLTGRTEIWDAVLRAHHAQPLLGYGYAAFWGLDSAPAKWIRIQLQWLVPSAHNGWLDLLVQLGDIGAALFGGIFAAALAAAVFRHQRVRDGYFATIFLVVFGLQTLSESIIMAHNSLPWVFAVAAIARMLGPAAQPAVVARRAAPEFHATGDGFPAQGVSAAG